MLFYTNLVEGLNVHSCCRLMASRCCSCVSGISLPQKIDLYSNFMRQGKVVLKILHTYDIYSIGPGTVLYCSFAISSSKQAHVETDTAIVGENDCIWNGGAAGEVNEETDCQLLVQGIHVNAVTYASLQSILFRLFPSTPDC